MSTASVLLMKEHERIGIGSEWNPVERLLSRHEAVLLDRMQSRLGEAFFEIGHRHLKATSWVGSIALGDKVIEVLPKLDSPQAPLADAAIRANLLRMLAASGNLRLVETDVAAMTASESPLIVALMAIYVRNLAREWRRGPIRRYVAEEDNRRFLKGKLLIAQHLRRNAVDRGRFLTAADELTEDNDVSRFLKAALVACSRQRFDPHVVRDARSLLGDFDGVLDVDVARWAGRAPQLDRTVWRFRPLVGLASHILALTSPERDADGNPCYLLMFDMNKVYERFIAAELERALVGTAFSASAQLGGRSLLRRDGRPVFALRPDIGVHLGGRLVAVLDTKWKMLDAGRPHNNVAQADMYQMYAYGKEYAVPRSVLLYPRLGAMPEVVATYEHPPDRTVAEPRRIVVATVDLARPLGQPAVRGALRRSLAALATGATEESAWSPAVNS